jgi:MerR family transcriptional regulator/heat shock protein HspR
MQPTSDLWDEPIYAISVAAEMVALHPQTLRRYEELGLLAPARRAGRRLYSPHDIALLRSVARLSLELGLNMAGVEVIFRLNRRIQELQTQMDRQDTVRVALEAQVAALEERLRQL